MDGTKRPSHGWADIERERIMAIKIGINGFGRIGRVVLRILAEQPISMRSAASTCGRQTWTIWSIC